ncbi:hypothetical protein N7491_007987 [Penicillium cf. griseofulvum]|nr:hypothetical protein N7491_007987 [Penicillium cf. griseofulvum]
MSYENYLPSAPKYEFKGVQDYQQILDQRVDEDGECWGSEYTIFTMDERSFLDFFLNSEERLLDAWESYDPSINQLLVIMPTSVHEVATTGFQLKFEAWIRTKNGNYPLDCTMGQTVRGTSGKRKCADCSWTPAHSGLSLQYPSIAVEVAWSDTRKKVEDDMRFWLTQTEGKVNVALSITVQKRGRIIVEEWGIKGTRIVPVQTIEIRYTNAPRGKGDTDFVLTPGDMEDMAKRIWRFQDGKLRS